MKKLISFSLWGNKAIFSQGAWQNAVDAPLYYPGWICRFYCAAEVAPATIERLQDLPGVEIVRCPEPGNWKFACKRFLAIDDPEAECVIFRDCDSRFSRRESAAVEEWLASGKILHVMKDHPLHNVFPILAGMFGLKRYPAGTIADRLDRFDLKESYHYDQIFLANFVWPALKDQALLHDGFYGQTPFPLPRQGLSYVGESFDEKNQPAKPWLREHLKKARPASTLQNKTAAQLPPATKGREAEKCRQLLMHGIDLQRKRQWQQAGDAYRQVLTIHPNHPEALHLLGTIALQTGDQEKAIELIKKAIALNPGAAAYHYNAGEAQRELNRLGDASDSYRLCLEKDPENEAAWAQLALVEHHQRHYEYATKNYQKALSLRPQNPRTLNNFGLLLIENNNFAGAKILLQKALACKPDYTQALHNLAVTLTQLGELDAARITYRKALNLNHKLPGARNQFVRLLQNTCNFEEFARELAIIKQQTTESIQNHRCPEESPYLNLASAFAGKENLVIATLWSKEKFSQP